MVMLWVLVASEISAIIVRNQGISSLNVANAPSVILDMALKLGLICVGQLIPLTQLLPPTLLWLLLWVFRLPIFKVWYYKQYNRLFPRL
ncbi:hypothetical protein LINPERHAP2_LOCUS421 [Linum perenne]